MSNKELKAAINDAKARYYRLFDKKASENMAEFIAGAVNKGLMAREDINPILSRE